LNAVQPSEVIRRMSFDTWQVPAFSCPPPPYSSIHHTAPGGREDARAAMAVVHDPRSRRRFRVDHVDEQDVVDQVQVLEQDGANQAVEVAAGNETVSFKA
jgi:hypothetical protein